MNTSQAIDFSGPCSWIPGSRAQPAPRNDDAPAFFGSPLVRVAPATGHEHENFVELLPKYVAATQSHYLSSPISSKRLPLKMLLTIRVIPFTCGCQHVPARVW